MKKFLLLIFSMVGFVACIDNTYDFSKKMNDDFAIGDDQSEFHMPLVDITLTASQMVAQTDANQVDVISLYQEADIWLPTNLPDGADYVEVTRLSLDQNYLNKILEALYAEMGSSQEKRESVCSLIARKYCYEFVSNLSDNVSTVVKLQIMEAQPAQAADMIEQLFLDSLVKDEVVESVGAVASHHLRHMQLNDVTYAINLNLGSDIEDMIINNLDPKGVWPAVNALYLFGEVESNFPFDLTISPRFTYTEVYMDNISVNQGKNTIDPVRIYAEDIEMIFYYTNLTVPVVIERYYPNQTLNERNEAHIEIRLRKTGALKF